MQRKQPQKNEITHLDLFSGVGGFSFALEPLGFRTVAFVESSDECRRVLRKHWPNTAIYNDVKHFPADEIGEVVDLITGGFPCQSVSSHPHGHQRGEADDRWLWPEMLEIIRKLRPTWVCGENVVGLINMGLIDTCLADLESEDYQTRAFVLPAGAVEKRHRRDRCFFLAHTNRQRCGGGSSKKRRTSKRQFQPTEREGSSLRREAERRCLFFGEEAPQSPVRRGIDGLPSKLDKIRYSQIGNAVVPDIVAQLGKAILAGERYG